VATTTTTTFLPNLHTFGGQPQGAYNPNTGQLQLPPGSYNGHLNFGWYQLNNTFAPWEVALTVVAAAVMVGVVFVFVRRLRRA